MGGLHVARLRGGAAPAAPLADGVVVVPAVAAEHAAGGVDEVAGPLGEIAVTSQERGLAGAGEEAQILRFGLRRHRQAGVGGQRADLRLGQLAEREPQARERGRGDRGQHVGLVLGRVGGSAQQPVGRRARVVAGGERRGAEAVGERDHRVEPDVAVAADARVRGHAGGVAGQERVHHPGAELLAQVEREVRQAHPVRDRAREADGVGRAARRLGVVGRVGPQLERHGGRPLARPERGDGGVAAAAHGDERTSGIRRQRGARPGGGAERAVQRVGRQVRGVELARRQAAELGGDLVRADARGVEHGGALDQRDGGRAGRDRRAAAGGLEARPSHAVAIDAQRDAYQVAAGGAAGAAVMRARRAQAASGGMLEVLAEALHER